MQIETDSPIHELISSRWSPYVYDGRSIAAADVRSLFEAARWAPSSYNEQPWRFIVAMRDEPELFARVLGCLVEGNQAWARHASVLALGVVSRNFERNGKLNAAAEHDLGLAAATLTFEATARGLHVHQMIGIVPERARREFAIPDGFDPLTAIAIGHAGDPAQSPELGERDRARRLRRPLEATVFGAKWGAPAPMVIERT